MYKVNFLPRELQRDFVTDINKLAAGALFALIIAGVLAVYGFFLDRLHLVEAAVAEAGRYLESLQAGVAAVEEVKRRRVRDEQTVDSLRAIMEKRISWTEVLTGVNSQLPADVWLARLELGNRDLPGAAPERDYLREGRPAQGAGGPPGAAPPAPDVLVLEGYSRSVSSVGVLVDQLGRIPVFSRVLLNELSVDRKAAAYTFKITALLKGGSQ